jgi:hypothetical protein
MAAINYIRHRGCWPRRIEALRDGSFKTCCLHSGFKAFASRRASSLSVSISISLGVNRGASRLVFLCFSIFCIRHLYLDKATGPSCWCVVQRQEQLESKALVSVLLLYSPVVSSLCGI